MDEFTACELAYKQGYEKGKNDAVPMVRCRDCKHMYIFAGAGARYCTAWGSFHGMGDDGFCGYGKRKEEK